MITNGQGSLTSLHDAAAIFVDDMDVNPGPSDYRPKNETIGKIQFASTIRNVPAFSINKSPSNKLIGLIITD
jgi:hypothetical protein